MKKLPINDLFIYSAEFRFGDPPAGDDPPPPPPPPGPKDPK
ncbi:MULTISPECIES: hypothetical protein [unclassified Imperialibacter]|nr:MULTISPECIES: hypothetical protein [unclassified Imperialibacter]